MSIKHVTGDEFIKIKHRGKIYTPDYLVDIILNQGHYTSGNIARKHVIDNSCGDGQFVIHVVDRYCKDYLANHSDTCGLKEELEQYIHAIEIDQDELMICQNRCSQVAQLYGVSNIHWNFVCADALLYDELYGLMDFVVGNPPYVRVHNLTDSFSNVKRFSFGNGGMTDLFIVFYEIGLRMLNQNGVLCYITPSSFFSSVAGTTMRHYLVMNHLLESVCDLKHFQPFNAMTYTTIICLNKGEHSPQVSFYEFDETQLKPIWVDSLTVQDYWINHMFYFANKSKLLLLRQILENKKQSDIQVKNGYATLADKCFISDFGFNSPHVIPVLKASRAKWTKIIYPYDKNGQLLSETELMTDEPLYEYLLTQKESLEKRDSEKSGDGYWYAFGRSQAITDTYVDKIAINSLIKTSADLKIVDVPAGSGVYSGLYIICGSTPPTAIKAALLSEEFAIFVRLLGKYKSGGYYTFSSKDVKCYLDYHFGNEENSNAEQFSVFDGH